MGLFKKEEDKGSLKILLDIRSASVGGAIILQRKGKEALVKYTIRERVFFSEKLDSEKFVNRIMKTLDTVLDNLGTKGMAEVSKSYKNGVIEGVFCVLASPWFDSRIKNFSIKKKDPIKFTKDFLDSILSKEKETDKLGRNDEIVDKRILSVSMNNYETTDPFNKKAKNIDLSFYTSTMGKDIKDEIEEKIKSKFHTKDIIFSTHPLVIITVIKSLFHSLSNFLLIDVGGENTEIGLYQDSVLKDLVTVPKGSHHFIREVAESCSLDGKAAESYLNLNYKNELSDVCKEKTSEVVNRIEKEWLSGIEELVRDTWSSEVIPATIFLTVDNPLSNLFKKILTERDGYMKTLKINKEPILHVVNNANTKELCDYDESVTKDALISVSAHFVDIDH